MDFEQIIELIDHVSASELSSFHYENGDTKISMKAGKKVVLGTNTTEKNVEPIILKEDTVTTGQQEKKVEPEGKIIKSPLVGTFYAAPAEDAPADYGGGRNRSRRGGDTGSKGQVLGILEAMKLMNDIESDFDGKIVEIYVENGDAVEYGQPLFCVE